MLKRLVRIALPPVAAYGMAALIDGLFHDWGATRAELTRTLPGDELVPEQGDQSTMAIDIHAPASEVWPWLIQMGCNRAGWYSYDFLDNGGVASARRLIPEFQDIAVGYVIPADPRATIGFPVLMVDPEQTLVLGKVVGSLDRRPRDLPGLRGRLVWSFNLEEPVPGRTRLLVRTRGEPQPPAERLLAPLFGAAHAFMQRRQLTSIKRRVETRIDRRVAITRSSAKPLRAVG